MVSNVYPMTLPESFLKFLPILASLVSIFASVPNALVNTLHCAATPAFLPGWSVANNALPSPVVRSRDFFLPKSKVVPSAVSILVAKLSLLLLYASMKLEAFLRIRFSLESSIAAFVIVRVLINSSCSISFANPSSKSSSSPSLPSPVISKSANSVEVADFSPNLLEVSTLNIPSRILSYSTFFLSSSAKIARMVGAHSFHISSILPNDLHTTAIIKFLLYL